MTYSGEDIDMIEIVSGDDDDSGKAKRCGRFATMLRAFCVAGLCRGGRDVGNGKATAFASRTFGRFYMRTRACLIDGD